MKSKMQGKKLTIEKKMKARIMAMDMTQIRHQYEI